MRYTLIKILAIFGLAALAFVPLAVLADASSTAQSLSMTAQKKIADSQIQARLDYLNAALNRVNQMEKLGLDQRSGLTESLQASIDGMTNLKTKIDADTDPDELKADIQSIKESNRIYVLVLPQTRIIASVDRIADIISMMTDFNTKVQARLSDEQTKGRDVSALSATIADMNSQTADASIQAQTALSLVQNLQPDNGDQNIFQSNKIALQNGKAKITAAANDLKIARKDIGTVLKIFQQFDKQG